MTLVRRLTLDLVVGAAVGLPCAVIARNVTLDDYPPEALRHKWEGVSGLDLEIDAAGHVASCAVTKPSGHNVLDTAACDLMRRRAMFAPAHAADGTPIASHYGSAVTWRLPH